MVPESSVYSAQNVKMQKENTKTYYINWDSGCVEGFCDGVEAVKQAIRKILGTERYLYLIYSFNYGFETDFKDYNGRSVFPVLRKRIEEALLQDDRIVEVKDFCFSRERGNISVEFTVVTVEGEFVYKKAVDIIV